MDGWAEPAFAAVWLESLFLQVGDVMLVALTAVNDQRALCFHSIVTAAASMGLSPPCKRLQLPPRHVLDLLLRAVGCRPPCSWRGERSCW